ncbi:MAG: YceI family protein [Ferruginibacter sp.]
MNLKKSITLLATALLLGTLYSFKAVQPVYRVTESLTTFHSKAKLELIKAASSKMQGAIDATKRTFAFTIDMNSFEGFNSPLQKEHFNENYMESRKYPRASFTGRIIEDDDFTKDGTYNLRAKGKFTVHGVEQERIIQADIQVKNGIIQLKSQFTVHLADHEIKIPRIVHEKLAAEILIDINATLAAK